MIILSGKQATAIQLKKEQLTRNEQAKKIIPTYFFFCGYAYDCCCRSCLLLPLLLSLRSYADGCKYTVP